MLTLSRDGSRFIFFTRIKFISVTHNPGERLLAKYYIPKMTKNGKDKIKNSFQLGWRNFSQIRYIEARGVGDEKALMGEA